MRNAARPRRSPTHPPGRGGATFLEILIAMAILAAAMVPISSMLVDTAGQSASTKAESQAANFAASLMNRFLDKMPFDDVVNDLEGEEDLDGTDVRWHLEVHDFQPEDVDFLHRMIKYHDPSNCQDGESVITSANFDSHSARIEDKGADELDRKNQGEVVLKELRLRIQWKTARDADYEQTSDPSTWRRTVILITRRARLKKRTS